MSRYHHSPFQILSVLSRDDLPLIERRRCCRSDLNEGPVSNESECDFSVRKGTAHDEMIVAMHQNADHGDLKPQGVGRGLDNQSRNGTPLVPA